MTGNAPAVLVLALGLTGSVFLARLAPAIIARVSGGAATISTDRALIACLVGCLPGFTALPSGFLSVQTSFTLLGIVLMLLAVIDRETSWAPDLLVIPVCCFAMWVGAQHAGEDPGVLQLVFRGLGFFAAFQVLYAVGSRAFAMIPPPDMIGLAMPFVVFGLSALAAASLAIVSMILISIRQSAVIRNFVLVPHVGEDIDQGRGLSVPFLAIVFPVVVAMLFWSPLLSKGG
jgi:hypothetical protein